MINNINTYLEQIQSTFGNVEYLKFLKQGKEAEVHILSVNGELTALKIYKINTKFSSRLEYYDINNIGDKRLIRAAKKKTDTGIKTISKIWTNREYEILETLYNCGALVPKPLMNMNQAILMEYLGNLEKPAPRLIDISLTKAQYLHAYNIIMEHINFFIEIGFAHGDLSPYNILWYKESPYIIDFPQITFKDNRNYRSILNNDLRVINEYFGHRI